MLSLVTWSEYFTSILILLAFYYLVIAIVYYRREISSFQFPKKISSNLYNQNSSPTGELLESGSKHDTSTARQSELFPSQQNSAFQIQETDDRFQQVQELTAGLKEVIKHASEDDLVEEEFILSLRLVIKKYSFLKGSPFLATINNLIASECEKYGYIRLSAEERVMLWNE